MKRHRLRNRISQREETGAAPPAPADLALLQEDGDEILQEDGDTIEQEGS